MMASLNFPDLFRTLIIGLVLTDAGVYGLCPGSLPRDKVATVCQAGVTAAGTTVYLDPSLTASTVNDTNTPLCTCTVTTNNVKLLTIDAEGYTASAGTLLTFTVDSSKKKEGLKEMSQNKFSVANEDVITVKLLKFHQPFRADYCVSIKADLCPPGNFQCNDGECISASSRCDNFPDCKDMSDEDDCGYGGCTEGQTACSDGSSCFTHSEKCDNITKCEDATDEIGCPGFSPDHTQATAAPVNTDPQLQITCEASNMFPTTTKTYPVTPPTSNDARGTHRIVTLPVIALTVSLAVVRTISLTSFTV